MGTDLLMPNHRHYRGRYGSLPGTMLGGLLIGWRRGDRGVSPAASGAVIMSMAVVRLIRPRGSLGEEGMMS
jgi:branched-chain amino acid transport system permease protein